jgi:elongation factor P
VERQPAQFLYVDGDIFYFMNKESFDQVPMNRDRVGDLALYLKENEDCSVLTYGEEAISVELPAAVVLEVSETDPWVKGDTAQGGTKPAKLETGLTVQVPLFVNTGDKVKVDTRSGEYLERAS